MSSYIVYRVPEGASCPELDLLGAQPGDHIVLRPSHPTAPLTLVRNYDRNLLPLILGASEECEVISYSEPPENLPEILRRVVGLPGPRPQRPRLRLLE